jgi:hypothetical protein
MNVFVFKNAEGKIVGTTTDPKSGIPISVDSPEYQAYLAEINKPQPPPSPFEAAEQWINNFFTASQLLQFKVWWDAYPHDLTPKLGAISVWQTGVTKDAYDGKTDFAPAPYNFNEVANEVLSIPAN